MKSSLLLSKLETQITEPYQSMAPLYPIKQKKSTKYRYVCLCVCIFVKYTERNFEGSHTNQLHLRRVMGFISIKIPGRGILLYPYLDLMRIIWIQN